MKFVLAAALIALSCSLNPAQDVSVEKDFESERPRLSLIKFSIGEDATSGFYYHIYRSKTQVRKIRSIWNGGCCNAPNVEDFYFKDGSPVLYVKLSVEKGQLDSVIKGRNTALSAHEKLYLSNSKLTMWIENGKTIPTSDPRWKDKEKFVLEQAKDQMDNYQAYKEEK